MEMETAPKVKLTIEGGIVVEVESEISLNVQIIDADARDCGEDWLEAFITTPKTVEFEDDGMLEAPQPTKPEESDRRGAELARYNQQYLLTPVFNGHNDILWYRDANGLRTNVPRSVIHHSPDGYEIGYGGSGPADLALNIAAILFPIKGEEDSVQCFYGNVSRDAWTTHQDLKFELLATVGGNKGIIGAGSINRWRVMAEFRSGKKEIELTRESV